ncbi:hypothetical protein [Colwellia sp. E2M01]|uniref:hypothetical protein n=1 Tax=Colwellia sp. E2M01 TaxID=2841561 RepID=UPI001C080271|nr:hypothetical protein [Colwellia sp. E2M01]MBU2871044.1 hypothetical protein [Colwellia sp. E2M01]
MVAFLKNKKQIKSVTIHPAAQDILSLIDDLKLTIPIENLSSSALELIENTIRMEGVLNEVTGELEVFSPLFDLRLTSKTLEQLLNKNTIIHRKDLVDEQWVESTVWGQFFKHISTSIRFVDDIALIQPELKKIFPPDICNELFGKKKLSQYDFSGLIDADRGKLTRPISKIPPKKTQKIKSSSSTFIPSESDHS